jgi:aspartyl-tRNA synthetase
MERTSIKDAINKKDGEKVLLRGWVHDTRDLKKVRFLVLKDVTGRTQVTGVESKTDKDTFELLDNLKRESAVEITGTVKDSKQAPGGKEILPDKLTIISEAADPLPIDVSDFSKTELPIRLDNRCLDTRRQKISPIFKIRSAIYKNIVNFFYENKFTIINTPKITTIGLESGAESFEVKYFKKKASLAQSPQFYKQMFVMGGFERVFEIGQVYRAEKSHTTRHLTEFTGVDFEMGFIKDENDVMDMIENMLKTMLKKVEEDCRADLETMKIELKVPKKIPRIPMGELKEMLSEKGKKLKENDDLDAEAEKMIGEYILETYGEEFVFVTNYPWEVRPFYHMKPEGDPRGTRSFDLLYKGVEIATGAQREHRLEVLKDQAKQKGMEVDEIYAEIFKYGAIPHGGVGFGLDRITQRLLNLENVREATLLPRDPERLTP